MVSIESRFFLNCFVRTNVCSDGSKHIAGPPVLPDQPADWLESAQLLLHCAAGQDEPAHQARLSPGPGLGSRNCHPGNIYFAVSNINT